MTWVRLDDQFADNPKLERAGPLAAWLSVAALCYSARHLTDGLIPQAKANRLAAVPSPGKQIKALLREGVWHEPGHDCDSALCGPCPAGHYLIHDFLDYQQSRAQVEAEREKERDKKRRQREAGTANTTNGPGGKFVGKPPGSPPGTTNGKPPGNHQGSPPLPVPSRPDPSDSRPQPTNVGTRPDTGDGQDQHPPPPPAPPDVEALLSEAASSLAWAETDRRHAAGEIANPDGYQRSRTKPIRAQHEPTWRRILEHEPATTAQQLIDAVTGHGHGTNGSSPAIQHPMDRQAAAARAAQLAGVAQVAEVLATPPADPDVVRAALAASRQAVRPEAS